MSLRWDAGEKVDAQWYLDRYPGLGEDTIVALIYEEFCLKEEDQENPDPAEFLARYPRGGRCRSGACSRSTSSSGRGRHRPTLSFSSSTERDGDLPDRSVSRSRADDRRFCAGGRAGPRGVRAGLPGQGARAGRSPGGAQGFAARLARAADAGAAAAHAHRTGALAPDRRGDAGCICCACPISAGSRLSRVLADPEVQTARIRGPSWPRRSIGSTAAGDLPAGSSAGRLELARRSYSRAIAWWCARLAEALAHAHDRGVLHRDIKPSNVLVTSDGMPMLLDFNLAREPLLEDGTAADTATLGGTIDYMAPEHLKALGEPIVARRSTAAPISTDWAWCSTRPSPASVPSRRRAGARRSSTRSCGRSTIACAACRRLRDRHPEIPPALEAVIRRCLEPDPLDRYQTAAAAGGRPSGRRRRSSLRRPP